MMELRHIRYFLVLAEELNFSRAAERLHIAQPSLSRQIQELETEIGAPLFYRTKRQVKLTNAGKTFWQKSNEIIDLVEQARITARLSSTGTDGDLRIGFTGTVQDLIPPLKAYREKFPNVRITLKQMSNAEQIDALHEHKIDLALISIPVKNDNIAMHPIKKMNFVAALPKKHPLAHKSSLSIADFADETLIMTPKSAGPQYYETMMEIFRKAGVALKQTIQAHDLQTVLVLVSADMGVALTPSPISALNGVVHRTIVDIDLSITGSMAWRYDNQSEVLRRFLTFIFDYLQIDYQSTE